MSTKNKRDSYIQHVKDSISRAEQGLSKLSPQILALPGMSNARVRHFLNNLCSLPALNYLEIGCWKGSTLTAALYKNYETLIEAVAIDDWSTCQKEPTKEIFLKTLETYLSGYPVRYIEKDCFSVQLSEIFQCPINIYFYDANHNRSAHEKAFTYFNSILDDTCIVIVDDWNWKRVQQGTRSAFKQLSYTVVYEREFFTTGNDINDWWNGVYVAVIARP